MPFQSESQRRLLWAKHPEVAKKWAHESPGSNKGLPMHKPKAKPAHRMRTFAKDVKPNSSGFY